MNQSFTFDFRKQEIILLQSKYLYSKCSKIFKVILFVHFLDYESKQRQLNIAIRRLQLVDAQTRRIDVEKRIMNWEKAFAKVKFEYSKKRKVVLFRKTHYNFLLLHQIVKDI